MTDRNDLIQELLESIRTASDAGPPTARFCRELDSPPTALLAIGKAAASMARADGALPEGVTTKALVIITPHQPTDLPRTIEVAIGDHPIPSERNLIAATKALEFVQSLTPSDHLLVLLSGGGSALLALPTPPLTLDDCSRVAEALMRAGCPIQKLNSVRKHTEQLKGGRLAQACAANTTTVACVSDVIGDSTETIASGPFAPDSTTYADTLDTLSRYNCLSVSPTFTEFLREGTAGKHAETLSNDSPGTSHTVILSNKHAVEAAAAPLHARNYSPNIINSYTGEARDLGPLVAESLKSHDSVVIGGEPTVSGISPGSIGGPVQEAVLAAALSLQNTQTDWLVFGIATDGIDGPTSAAGAALDRTSFNRIHNPAEALRTHNTHNALQEADALIATGPTGTNINDVIVALRR